MFRGGSWCFRMFHGGLWWFMVVCDVSWWFVMVCGVSWWFMMFHGGLWCFVVVRDGLWWFFSTILKKISCDPLFNQSESKIQYQISFWMRLHDGSWWFVVVRDDSWWFMMVRGGSWWFVVVRDVFFSRERSCDPLFNQSESQIHYQLLFWMRLRNGSWWFIRDGFVVVRDVSWWFVVVRDDSWWFVVVRDDSWWFVMFFSLEKGHVTLFSTNQSPKFTINSYFGWDFVMVRDGLFVMVSWWFVMFRGGLWWFMVVRDDSWWFVMFFSLEKGHVTLFSTNQSPKFTINSHFGWDFVMVRDGLFVMVSWWFVMVPDVLFSRERSRDPLFNQSET